MSMAATAEELAKDYGFTLKILEREECEALGMGAFLGVAQASEMPPKFIHLTYTPSWYTPPQTRDRREGFDFRFGWLEY